MINIDDHSEDPDEIIRLRRHFDALAVYCTEKAKAMRCRLKGNIQDARIHENTCERIYATLPDDLRW